MQRCTDREAEECLRRSFEHGGLNLSERNDAWAINRLRTEVGCGGSVCYLLGST